MRNPQPVLEIHCRLISGVVGPGGGFMPHIGGVDLHWAALIRGNGPDDEEFWRRQGMAAGLAFYRSLRMSGHQFNQPDRIAQLAQDSPESPAGKTGHSEPSARN